MNRRYTTSRRLFYLGLVIVLLAGILSGGFGPQLGSTWPVIMLIGAVLALGGRLWLFYLRSRTHEEPLIDTDMQPRQRYHQSTSSRKSAA
jgi:protein-S-isoprenylcysteine O-methyltransferase Ste14